MILKYLITSKNIYIYVPYNYESNDFCKVPVRFLPTIEITIKTPENPFFKKSDFFSIRNRYSFSSDFTQSTYFSNSIYFTQISHFMQSNHFTQSTYFSNSMDFAQSMKFTKSMNFIHLNIHSKSSFQFITTPNFSKENNMISKSYFHKTNSSFKYIKYIWYYSN